MYAVFCNILLSLPHRKTCVEDGDNDDHVHGNGGGGNDFFFIFISTPEGHERGYIWRIIISFQSGSENID